MTAEQIRAVLLTAVAEDREIAVELRGGDVVFCTVVAVAEASVLVSCRGDVVFRPRLQLADVVAVRLLGSPSKEALRRLADERAKLAARKQWAHEHDAARREAWAAHKPAGATRGEAKR